MCIRDRCYADEKFENQDLSFITHWRLATEHFEKSFYGNKLGFVCGVYDRIRFKNDLKRPNAAVLQFLQQEQMKTFSSLCCAQAAGRL